MKQHGLDQGRWSRRQVDATDALSTTRPAHSGSNGPGSSYCAMFWRVCCDALSFSPALADMLPQLLSPLPCGPALTRVPPLPCGPPSPLL